MTDTSIELLPGGLIKGYCVIYGRRTLKMGLYWTPLSDVRLAHAAYCKAATELHGEFAKMA